jgi:ABC-type bacteriocin/lantibiotic exporter with double-glycine peptidase domain
LPEVHGSSGDPGTLTGDIELSHVSFRYSDSGPLILDDLSLRVEPGQMVAIVGPSGSGKSTLFRLLLGLEQTSSGAVLYDGQSLANLDVEAVRRQIGVVLQRDRVQPGDVFHNIVGQSSSLTVADAWEAARAAGLEDDINAMPMGMHTNVNDGGGTFSGGQRQRLLIARAIVHKPRILLFDEATSALDNRTQKVVSDSLAQLRVTRVVIAHRLSTIQHADKIYVLDQGRVVESGNYAELSQRDGLFAHLIRRQLN